MKVEIIKQGNVDVLQVQIPIVKRPSGSGKTTLVASTNGNKQTDLHIDGKPVTIGLNAWIK
jgi:ABC-type lipoprotein export system ATPase subunit